MKGNQITYEYTVVHQSIGDLIIICMHSKQRNVTEKKWQLHYETSIGTLWQISWYTEK